MSIEWELGGDRYRLILPLFEQVHEVWFNDPELLRCDKYDNILFYKGHIDGLFACSKYGYIPSFYPKDDSNRNQSFLFYTVLAPLDEQGKIDRSMQELNPDGTLVNYGKYRSAEPHCDPDPAADMYGDLADVTLTDTFSEHPLEWVWLDGLLIGRSPALYASLSFVLQSGIIADSREVYREMLYGRRPEDAWCGRSTESSTG